jgi:hypothetical protein
MASSSKRKTTMAKLNREQAAADRPIPPNETLTGDHG